MVLRTIFLSLLVLAASRHGLVAASTSSARRLSYEHHVAPILSKYCYDCHGNGKHKGDVQLDLYKNEADAAADPKTWEKVMQNVRGHVMPPEKKAQPSASES